MGQFKYNPKDAVQCLVEGDYPATITGAEEKTSKTDKPMLVITFKVYSNQSAYAQREVELKEYIVPEMAWKLKRIARAIGAEAAFLKGEFFAADYVGRNLTLTLIVEETADYGDQNRVKAYKPMISMVPQAPPTFQADPSQMKDETIPF